MKTSSLGREVRLGCSLQRGTLCYGEIRQRVQEGYNCGLRGRVRHLRKRIAHPVEVDDLLKRREEVAMPGGRGQFDVAER